MNCIKWFNTLIAENGLEGLKKEFKLLAEQQAGYFMSNHLNYDFNDETVYYVDIEKDGKMLSNSYSFSGFADKKIDEETKGAILCIAEKAAVLDEKKKAEYFMSLNKQINTLAYVNEKSGIPDIRESVRGALAIISDYVKTEPNSQVQNDYTSAETIFGFKGGTTTGIKALYNSLEILGFFSPEDNQYDRLYRIIITPIHPSTMLVNLQAVTVACDNYKAAYILSKIEPLFSRLSFRNIGKSGLFNNRLGKPFTESDLSKAKTKFKQKAEIDDALKDEIDRELNPLIHKR